MGAPLPVMAPGLAFLARMTPEIGAVLNEVSGKLDNATLIALNQQVDLQHKDPAAVAEQWVNANLSQH